MFMILLLALRIAASSHTAAVRPRTTGKLPVIRPIRLWLALWLPLLPLAATGAEVYGVKMPEAVTVEGKRLKLNGMGVRTKTFLNIKVYVAGLYLETPRDNPDEIIAFDGVRRIQMEMTHDASKARLIDEIVDGLRRNAQDKMAKLKQRLDIFLGGVPNLKKGETLTITYVTGKGTSIMGTGGDEVTVPGKDFADAIMSAWLGVKPLDDHLKKRLLCR